ncbi:hypothetical protein AXK21_01840 [Streptococcus pyogenes]|uniref:hypothetical protein n=1 Tax=Streptococcus pyogenes TaxID=1314 RepID=UPI0007C7637E|nr:hypothetical protein AXK21_01840 [Streptococcus pyogenes]
MKTKSKRFLNLATLCLALLGTTLLMAHPVKAEMMQKSDYMAQFWAGDSGEYPADLEARYKGYVDGYKKGLEGHDVPTRPNIQVPRDVPSSNDTEYKDGYEEGLAKGQRERDSLGTTGKTSQESEGRQAGSETPEASRESEEGQEESDDQQGDMLTPIVETIIEAVEAVLEEAWAYVLSWFNS